MDYVGIQMDSFLRRIVIGKKCDLWLMGFGNFPTNVKLSHSN